MSVSSLKYRIHSCGISDVGLVRSNNEDVWIEMPEEHFYILADGMGGHQAGEVAAKEAVSSLEKYIDKHFSAEEPLTLDSAADTMRYGIQIANSHVYRMSRTEHHLRGMGTTLCALYLHREGIVYAHVGDSRIYRLRNKRLVQMTQDHSLIREMVDRGRIDETEAQEYNKNIITRAIGADMTVSPTVQVDSVEENDLYLMCTDGLSDLLADDYIQDILNAPLTLQQMAESLVNESKKMGGYDNISVILLKVELEPQPTELASSHYRRDFTE